jgi:hypothetical protein
MSCNNSIYSRLILDTGDRNTSLYPNSNNCVISLSQAYSVKELIIESISIPFSYYTINSSNYNLEFFVFPTTYNINIPFGNYSGPQLASQIQSLMNTVHPAPPFSVSYNANNYKFTFSNTINFTLVPTGVFSVLPTLGFLTSLNYSGTSLTSTNVANLTGPNQLYISSVALTPFKVPKAILNKGQSNVFAIIPVLVLPSEIISYIPNQSTGAYFDTPIILKDIDLRLHDKAGNLIDLNGLDFILSLLIKTAA